MINRDAFGRSAMLAAIWLLCVTSPAFAQIDIGALRVTLPPVAAADDSTARLAVRDVAIMRLRAVDSVLRPILPGGTRFDVSVETCGRPDYLYDRDRRRVVLCTEMDGFARTLVKARLGRGRVAPMEQVGRDDEAEDALDGFAVFATLHEFGHAAIDQLGLPVLRSAEGAADDFAAYALLARGEYGTVLAAAQWLAQLEAHLMSNAMDSSQGYADAHPVPGQRYERLRCLLEGRMAPDSNEATNRPACQSEWLRLAGAWQNLLRSRSGQ